MKDQFEITMLNPTIPGGREWFSSWNNEISRTLSSGEKDPEDPEFHMRGKNGKIKIDVQGIAELCGDSPRMYVYNMHKPKWKNVEITFYGMRIGENSTQKSQGFVSGARSEHQDYSSNPCLARTY
jgi:hypothetical protein